MVELPSREDVLYVVTKTAIMLGVLGIGAALGLAVGLAQLQGACIAANVLPPPGTPLGVAEVMLDGNPCWAAAQWLQEVANGVGVGAAALLIAGGVLDRHQDRVAEVLAGG